MGRLNGTLVTVRTAKQGALMMKGKMTSEYLEEISTLRVNPDDMDELALSPGEQARITSPYGEAIVACNPADVPRGLFFMPLGPLANRLFSGLHTHGTGVPDWKGQSVTIEPVGHNE